MVAKELEVERTELELHGELQVDLVYTVQELQEDWSETTALPS